MCLFKNNRNRKAHHMILQSQRIPTSRAPGTSPRLQALSRKTIYLVFILQTVPIKQQFPIPPPSAPGNHNSSFSFYEFDYFNVSHKWNHTVFAFFVISLFHFSLMSSRFIHVLASVGISSFLRLNNISLYLQTTFCYPFIC